MKTSVLSLAALLCLATTHAMAATTDLTVTGTITPTACTPTLSNGGQVDYGVVSLANLGETGNYYLLPAKNLSFAIECSAPTSIAVIASDNRRDSAPSELKRFGLGMHEDQQLGNFFIRWINGGTLVDGETGYHLDSLDGGTSWIPASTLILSDFGKDSGFRASFANQPSPSAPSAVTSVSINLEVNGFLNKSLTLTDNAQLDGSATLEVVYL